MKTYNVPGMKIRAAITAPSKNIEGPELKMFIDSRSSKQQDRKTPKIPD